MPSIFIYRGYRFFFYANEGEPREPMHVHIRKDQNEAKLWMEPAVTVAYNDGYPARVLRELILVAATNRHQIAEAWNDFFNT